MLGPRRRYSKQSRKYKKLLLGYADDKEVQIKAKSSVDSLLNFQVEFVNGMRPK